MSDVLLELFSEEIPARMQQDAALQLRTALSEALEKHTLTIAESDITLYVTPRRLAVWVKNLPSIQPDITIEKKGPKTTAPQAALDGFLKSSGLTFEQLEKRMVGKDEVYYGVMEQKGGATKDVMKPLLEKILLEFSWPKSMRWASHDFTWVRPLHNILCLFDGAVLPIRFHHLTANNQTFGHRFLAPGPITVAEPSGYETALKKAFVIADFDVRKKLIWEQMEKAAASKNCTLRKDERLLNEVTGLVEWPVVRVGKIADNYMPLPEEVLVSEMKQHQKYFPLYESLPLPSGEGRGEGISATKSQALTQPSPEGRGLSSFFLITANTDKGEENVIAGNERVLRARLADGEFFWNQDRNTELAEWAKKLSVVTYHAKLGTIADKVTRIEKLAVQIAHFVIPAQAGIQMQEKLDSGFRRNDSAIEKIKRAAQLCKADLVTGMVGEFPELQGVMGRYYALEQKEASEVADAIRDHYLPLGPDSPVPNAPVSICVALADKIDTLVSMFAIGEKPTGSKDPFALRRAALGIIRIILSNRLRLPLLPFLSSSGLTRGSHAIDSGDSRVSSQTLAPENDKQVVVAKELLAFFHDRLKVMLKDNATRHDIVTAVIRDDDDLTRIALRADDLQEFLNTPQGVNLLAGYKRASNIVAIEEKKDKKTYRDKVRADALAEPEEKTLHMALQETLQAAREAIKKEDYISALSAIAMLRAPVDAFFDKVMVNVDNKELRENRLCLLSQIRTTLDVVADFSLIEG